jgi:hypothetical protein
MLVKENCQAVPDGVVIRHCSLKQYFLYIPRQVRPELECGPAQQFHELAGSIVHLFTFEPFAALCTRLTRTPPNLLRARKKGASTGENSEAVVLIRVNEDLAPAARLPERGPAPKAVSHGHTPRTRTAP